MHYLLYPFEIVLNFQFNLLLLNFWNLIFMRLGNCLQNPDFIMNFFINFDQIKNNQHHYLNFLLFFITNIKQILLKIFDFTDFGRKYFYYFFILHFLRVITI